MKPYVYDLEKDYQALKRTMSTVMNIRHRMWREYIMTENDSTRCNAFAQEVIDQLATALYNMELTINTIYFELLGKGKNNE